MTRIIKGPLLPEGDYIKVKAIINGSAEWQKKIIDMETGRLLPGLRGSISYTINEDGFPLVSVQFIASEIEDHTEDGAT